MTQANPTDRRLIRHIAWVLALKLLALFALWWLFVHERTLPVSGSDAAEHLLQEGSPR